MDTSATTQNLTIKFVAFFVIALVFGFSGTAQAQDYYGFSYSTSLPDQVIGFDFRHVKVSGVSFFGSVKSSPFPPEAETYESISEDTFDDPQLESKTVKTSISVGLTFGITKTIHLWAGAGLTGYNDYAKLNDRFDILGDRNGNYWVQSSKETIRPKVLGGVGATTGTAANGAFALIGYEYNPEGINVSIGYRW